MGTRRPPPWLAASAVLLLPAASHAEQFDFGARSGLVWDSNVYGTPEDAGDDPVSDSSWRFSPFAEVSDPDGKLTWALHYQPSYEYYLQESELSGFDQSGFGSLRWNFADRWSIQLVEQYAQFRSPVRFNQIAADPADPVNLQIRTNEITSNLTNAVLRHQLSRRDSLSLALNYSQIDYSSGEGNNRASPSATLVYDHILSERTSAGARFSWIQQSNELQSGEDDTTEFYNLSGFVNHAFSRTLRLELAGGPTFIDSTPASVFRPRQFGVRINPNLGPVGIDANTCIPDATLGAFVTAPDYSDCRGRTGVLTDDEAEILSKLTKKVPTIDAQGRALELSGSGETDLTYFAHVALIKDWGNWNATFAYQRSNSDTASFGSSAVADSLEASLHWKPRPFWTLYLSAAVSLQEQTTEGVVPQQFVVLNAPAPPGVTIPGGQLAEVQSIIAEGTRNAEKAWLQSASFAVTRQLTRHSAIFASVYWYSQRSELDTEDDRTTRWNNLTFYVGFDWKFDPIRF